MRKQGSLINTSHVAVPPTQGIKYAGSKLQLLPYIFRILAQVPDAKTFFDGFAGTTRVSQAAAQLGFATTCNDSAVWSKVFATCYLLSEQPDAYYQEILDHLNSLRGRHGWFTEHYGGKPEEGKKPFQIHNTLKLDAIREEIDRLHLNDIDTAVILTSLILALDRVDNSLGHFASYLAQWAPRSYNSLDLAMPQRFPLRKRHRVLQLDIFEAIQQMEGHDIAYLDPPYGSNNEKMPPSRVRYASYYHLWKTVILNDKPALFGKAQRREDSRDTVTASIFEEFRKAPDGSFYALKALARLLKEVKAHYVLLSYSSGGRATWESLLDILHTQGKLHHAVQVDYKKNVMATMRWTHAWASDQKNLEYLFLWEK